MITPTQEYRRTSHRIPEPLPKGIDARLNSALGRFRRRGSLVDLWLAEAHEICGRENEISVLNDQALHTRLMEFREKFRRGGREKDTYVGEALGAIREAARRQLGLHPFPVQLVGALALHRGFLAEMATGEGKTLTAGLAAVLAGWTNRPCHIVTVNDYLAKRDAEWLQPLYHFCGVRVGYVTGAMDPSQRRKSYGCDITYTTSKELLADFLRDRLQLGGLDHPARRLIRQLAAPGAASDRLVMRGLDTAIVDEADSVLIDEAVTPLIISAQQKNDALREIVGIAQKLIEDWQPAVDYVVNVRYREVELTDGGTAKLENECARLSGIWRGTDRRLEVIKQALVAREFFLRDKQYVIKDGKLIIVDEFTGRQMPQRSWRQGMHQAIEAKENLPVTDPAETIARMSFQRFFRHFKRLSGMTGTANEAADELWQIYSLPVVRIPTNRPCIRTELPDRLFAREDLKWDAVVEAIQSLHQTGRPVLIGTRSVAASENLAARLEQCGLDFKLLNAVRHEEEAAIVAMAGERGRITIATNMAGRGTDIKLGHGVADLGGLHVIATERHESRRVDRQLFGRAARQGDPGSAQAFVSAEDELVRRYLPPLLQRNLAAMARKEFPGSRVAMLKAFDLAQRNAQRQAYHQRRAVLSADDWLDEALSFASSP